MLLKIYKSNPLFLLVSGIAFCLVLWGTAVLHPNEIAHSYTDVTLLAPFFDRIHNFPMAKGILGLALLLLIAGLWNRVVNKHSLLRQSTYFPFFFTLLLLSCRPGQVSFYPSLASALFLILFLDRMISSYKKERALSNVFDSGLFIGIATLFYIPSMLFLLVLWVSLFTIRSISGREWLCSIIGFLLPFIFTFTYNLVFFPNYPWYNKISGEFSYHKIHFSFGWEQYIIIVLIIITAATSLWFFINKASDNVLKTQKFWNLLMWFMLVATITVLICPVKDARAFTILAIPGSFVLSAYFLKTRAKLLPELLFLSLVGGVIISMFF